MRTADLGEARATPGRHGPVSPERASREAASAIDRIKQGSGPLRSSPVEPRSCQHRRGHSSMSLGTGEKQNRLENRR